MAIYPHSFEKILKQYIGHICYCDFEHNVNGVMIHTIIPADDHGNPEFDKVITVNGCNMNQFKNRGIDIDSIKESYKDKIINKDIQPLLLREKSITIYPGNANKNEE